MKVTANTPNLLVIRFTRWKAPLVYSLLTVGGLVLGLQVALNPEGHIGWLILVLLLTVAWTLPMALMKMEKSMLVLNGETGQAELRHRTASGLHRHTWPLQEVQSTRVTRDRRHGPAAQDPKRIITLYVREGMDEGRHKLANFPVAAQDALSVSAQVSDWMADWRSRVDSDAPDA